jgi:site-specific recombinase XerC
VRPIGRIFLAKKGTIVQSKKKNHPNLTGSIQSIIRINVRAALRKKKVISQQTIIKRTTVIFSFFRELRSAGFHIKDPKNLSQKHIKFMVRKWESAGLAASTMQTRLSVMRGFCEWMNKPGMVHALESYLENKDNAKRNYIAIEDKSWSAKLDDVDTLIAKVAAEDEIVGVQLRLMLEFGMRKKEAICFKPKLADRGGYIVVTEGTKGGRDRVLAVTTDAQRQLLDYCKLRCASATAHLGRPGKTLLQEMHHFEYIMAKFGITRKVLGVTSHGLRHQYLNDRYEEISGKPSPVRGGGEVNKELNEMARYRVSELAGHSRINVTSAYFGSNRRMKILKPATSDKSESEKP